MSMSMPTAERISEWLHRLVEIAIGDVNAAARLGIRIERPDLHAGDPLLHQADGELIGAVEKPVEILVRSFVLGVTDAPVVDGLSRFVTDIAIARTGVIGANHVLRFSAEELVDRLIGNLAEQVPKRDIEGGITAHLDAG